jgi:hypothetical protein
MTTSVLTATGKQVIDIMKEVLGLDEGDEVIPETNLGSIGFDEHIQLLDLQFRCLGDPGLGNRGPFTSEEMNGFQACRKNVNSWTVQDVINRFEKM